MRQWRRAPEASRFSEVWLGIAEGLTLAALWPEDEPVAKSAGDWFRFNYFVVVAAVACSRSTSLRRAALPRSARR
jgi:hypothetical protein